MFWPTFVPASVVGTRSCCPTAAALIPPPAHRTAAVRRGPAVATARRTGDGGPEPDATATGAAATGRAGRGDPPRPLGLVCGARSGDKGGNANVGLWTRRPDAYPWLREYLDIARFRELLPEAAELEIRRYELPNLCALNFVVVGLLGLGVAASTRPDPQAKGLGEYLRSRYADIPAHLLPD